MIFGRVGNLVGTPWIARQHWNRAQELRAFRFDDEKPLGFAHVVPGAVLINRSRMSAPPVATEFGPLSARSKRIPGCNSPPIKTGRSNSVAMHRSFTSSKIDVSAQPRAFAQLNAALER